jgi:transposase
VEREEAEAVYDAGREACAEFLVEPIARYERQIARLGARVERLEERLRENSSNSSRPPSADAPQSRPPRGRPGDRPRGGQPGHAGTTRKLVPEGELAAVIDHWPQRCSGCGRGFDLSERRAADPHRHQVSEPRPVAVSVTEHRAHALCCRGCGKRTRASFPAAVARSAFGPRLEATVALLSVRPRVSRRDAVK